jgi:hypothetical protein
LAYNRRPALKWRMVTIHKQHFQRRDAKNTTLFVCFRENVSSFFASLR